MPFNLLCKLELSFPAFISQKPGEILIFWNTCGKNFNFGQCFTENRIFEGFEYL